MLPPLQLLLLRLRQPLRLVICSSCCSEQFYCGCRPWHQLLL